MNNPIRRNPLTAYFLLTLMISWGAVLAIAGPERLPINAESSEELLPLLYVSMLFGPAVAGVLMILLTEGKAGLRRVASQFLRWRVPIGWYALALFAAPVLALLLLFMLSFLSPGFQAGFPGSESLPAMLFNGLLVGMAVGLFEELGWTGFATPRLVQRYSIILSGLVIGTLWGAWHFILFWERDSFTGILPFFILMGRLLAWLPPFRVFMVWVYERTESLLLTVLIHMSLVFTTTVIVPMSLTGKHLLLWIVSWGAVLWLAVFILDRKKLIKRSTSGQALP